MFALWLERPHTDSVRACVCMIAVLVSAKTLSLSLMLEWLPVGCVALCSHCGEQRDVLCSPSAPWHWGVVRPGVGGGKYGGLRLDLPPVIPQFPVPPPAFLLLARLSDWLPWSLGTWVICIGWRNSHLCEYKTWCHTNATLWCELD